MWSQISGKTGFPRGTVIYVEGKKQWEEYASLWYARVGCEFLQPLLTFSVFLEVGYLLLEVYCKRVE